MGDVHEALDEKLIEWIGEQHVFFVATAPAEGGHVNLSPKGHDALRVLDDRDGGLPRPHRQRCRDDRPHAGRTGA